METSTWVIAGATMVGPILAVQAQKLLDHVRQRGDRKDWIFHTLMAYRNARLAQDYVRALNMIDLAFHGSRYFGVLRQGPSEKRVISAWRDFHRHLTPKPPIIAGDPREEAWIATSNDLFVNLLRAMATERGYDFNTDVLQLGGYLPQGVAEAEDENIALRKSVLDIARGRRFLPIVVMERPPNARTPLTPAGTAPQNTDSAT